MNATARRRVFGALLLIGALAMLIAGQTLLKGRLGAVWFLVYWMTCFVLTILAIVVALADAKAIRRRTLQEERDLVETTLKQIESEARAKGRAPGSADRH